MVSSKHLIAWLELGTFYEVVASVLNKHLFKCFL